MYGKYQFIQVLLLALKIVKDFIMFVVFFISPTLTIKKSKDLLTKHYLSQIDVVWKVSYPHWTRSPIK